MVQIPIIVPVVVLGVTVGALLRSKRIPTRKMIGSSSLVSGLLNAAYAFILNMANPPQNFAQGATQIQGTSELPFVVASFLTGVLMVFAVLVMAVIYLRLRGTEEIEKLPELTEEKL